MSTSLRSAVLAACCAVAAACAGPAGQDGKPCTVTDNGNGSATISCPDGTTVTVKNGTDGATGTNGTNGTNGTSGTNGTNGVNGTSCTVAVNPDAGTKVVSCTDGTSVTLYDGVNGIDANAITDFATLSAFELAEEDFSVTVLSVSNAPRPVVRFTVKDRKGKPVKGIPASQFSGIALLQLVPGNPGTGGNGLAIDTWVSHIANCGTCRSSTETANSTTLVDDGSGTYTYTFAKDVVTPKTLADGGVVIAGVAFDANAVHRFAMRLSASGNPYRPVDATFDYVPASGANADGQNEKVKTENCLSCHNQWRANAKNIGGATPFHSGTRYDVRYCAVCHNNQRKYSGTNENGNAVIAEPTIDGSNNMTPPTGSTSVAVLRGEAVIDMPVFFHKIHNGEHLTLKGPYAGLGTEINEFEFPQDVRNCTKCHSNAAKADNWKTRPSRRACGSCHDNVNFATGQGHSAGSIAQTDDSLCVQCHGETAQYAVAKTHLAVAKPDPSNPSLGGTNNNTHGSFMGNILNPPTGARVFTYDIKEVTTVSAGVSTDGGALVSPAVTFRYLENNAPVAFNVYDGGSSAQLFDNFVGAPSVYCAFAMPQDGVEKPADFNATASVYLRSAWMGTATGNSASTMTGPDSSGYYTVTITGTKLPTEATMLTCGLGYSYNFSSTQPLTQADVPGYAYDAGTRYGGLSMPAKNVWRVATGYTGRRGASNVTSGTGQIVQTSRCADCHNQLGVSPSYHGGQRNDAATCAFCHTQNRTSSGWTAGSESFIHAIHSAQRRTVPFNWHAVAATAGGEGEATGFWGVEYPGRLNYCESCHQPGYYDFSASWYTTNNGANLGTRMLQTVATGTYDANASASLAISVSPYVVSDGTVNYGNNYSYNVGTQVTTEAAGTTLVISPVANTCFGCHDSEPSRLHMLSNGATIYGARDQAKQTVEQCLICHGPGKTAAIKEVHYK